MHFIMDMYYIVFKGIIIFDIILAKIYYTL